MSCTGAPPPRTGAAPTRAAEALVGRCLAQHAPAMHRPFSDQLPPAAATSCYVVHMCLACQPASCRPLPICCETCLLLHAAQGKANEHPSQPAEQGRPIGAAGTGRKARNMTLGNPAAAWNQESLVSESHQEFAEVCRLRRPAVSWRGASQNSRLSVSCWRAH